MSELDPKKHSSPLALFTTMQRECGLTEREVRKLERRGTRGSWRHDRVLRAGIPWITAFSLAIFTNSVTPDETSTANAFESSFPTNTTLTVEDLGNGDSGCIFPSAVISIEEPKLKVKSTATVYEPTEQVSGATLEINRDAVGYTVFSDEPITPEPASIQSTEVEANLFMSSNSCSSVND